MNAWGILGNPTSEQIDGWKNLPYGQFRTMVNSLSKKSKGKVLQKYTVEIKKSTPISLKAVVEVQAFDSEHAISQIREINTLDLEWSEPKTEPETITYRVSKIW